MKKKRVLAAIVLCLSVVCFLKAFNIFFQHSEEQKIYDDLSLLTEESEDDGQGIPKPRKIDWDKLKKECPGVVAWIDVYGIDIGYPVMQGKDNEYYLNHASTGEPAACGAIFLNSTGSPDFSDQNSVVFGHYMKRSTMFGKLSWFAKRDAYEKSPYIRVYTPERNILYQIVSAYEVKVSDGVPDTYDIEEKEEKEYVAWFEKQLSLSEKEMEPCEPANMLTLSTCTGNGHSYRTIVQAAEITDNTTYTAADIINCLGYDPDDYVELGDYKNIKVSLKEEDYTVTDQDIRERIDTEAAQMPVYTKTTKKTVEDGDTVRIDYSGILEGEEEPSWEGNGDHLTIGSGQMLDGFETGLIGHSVGDTVKLDLSYPDDYFDASLAAKKISFEVEIEAIETVKTVQADKMTDDYVLVHFYDLYQVKTVEELHDYEKEQLEKDMETQKETDRKEKYLEELVSVSRFHIPTDLIETQTERYVESIRKEADENGSDFEAYLSNAYGFDSESALRSYIEEFLLEDAKESFVLCAVMEDTGFTVEKNAFESALETRALEYGYDDVEQFMEAYGGKADLLLSYAKDSLLWQLAKTM